MNQVSMLTRFIYRTLLATILLLVSTSGLFVASTDSPSASLFAAEDGSMKKAGEATSDERAAEQAAGSDTNVRIETGNDKKQKPAGTLNKKESGKQKEPHEDKLIGPLDLEKKEKDGEKDHAAPRDDSHRDEHKQEKGPVEKKDDAPMKQEQQDNESKKNQPSDPKKHDHIGLVLGYGGTFPVGPYGDQYKPAHVFSAAVPLYVASLWRFTPELHVRYGHLASIFSRSRYNSSMTMVQLFPAIAYRQQIPVPKTCAQTLVAYGRIFDGVTRLEFKSWNNMHPLLGRIRYREYINVFGVGAGLEFELYRGLVTGFDCSYALTATAGRPLQTVSLMVNAGYRL